MRENNVFIEKEKQPHPLFGCCLVLFSLYGITVGRDI